MTTLGRVAVLTAIAGPACTVPNFDHCLHQKPDGHTWCVANEDERPFCSPCERVAEHHHGRAIARLEHDPARGLDLRHGDGERRLELRAQARLLARGTAAEVRDLQEHDARQRFHTVPKDAGFARL